MIYIHKKKMLRLEDVKVFKKLYYNTVQGFSADLLARIRALMFDDFTLFSGEQNNIRQQLLVLPPCV